MTWMPKTREALTARLYFPVVDDHGLVQLNHVNAALAEVEAVDRVVEAAQLVTTMWAVDHTRAHGYPRALIDALARLAAVRDGQTKMETKQEAYHRQAVAAAEGIAASPGWMRENAVPPARPSASGACPCRVHGDPDGDCGEENG